MQVEAAGSTWISLSWEQVLTSAGISSQIVILSLAATTHNVTVDGGQSNWNITDLLPGNIYTIQIVVVADDGQMSFPSVAITALTLYPCKVLTACVKWIPY